MNDDYTVSVEYVPEDYRRLRSEAAQRRYDHLGDYVRDCSLGKYEPRPSDEPGSHVRNALLVFELAREAAGRSLTGGALASYLDALKNVLSDAADKGELG